VNVLLVGLGRWGEKHVRVLREIGVTLWVADTATDRLAAAVRQGVEPARAVTDYREALPHVDAVDVVTPADSHLAIARAALEAGRHCFVEKPLTATAADARTLATLATERKCVLQPGHIFRFHPATAALRDALDADRIGRVRFATARFSGFKRPRTDVGVTYTDAIHYFDLFAYLLGRPATAVEAIQRDYLGRGLDDVSLTIAHYGDVFVVVEANYFVPGTHRECVLVGERGSLEADFGSGTVTLHQTEHAARGRTWEAIDAGKEELTAVGPEPLRLELESFLDACQGRRPVAVSAADGIEALRVVEAAARAASLGHRVTL
jgi:predicted dehydrogenase